MHAPPPSSSTMADLEVSSRPTQSLDSGSGTGITVPSSVGASPCSPVIPFTTISKLFHDIQSASGDVLQVSGMYT
jgi:hypothetical protein